MKGVMRYGKNGKISPRYMGLYLILNRVGNVFNELEFPPYLGFVHLVFSGIDVEEGLG